MNPLPSPCNVVTTALSQCTRGKVLLAGTLKPLFFAAYLTLWRGMETKKYIQILAENFDCVSIFFGDIIGFNELTSDCTANEVTVTLSRMAGFQNPYFKVLWEGGKTKFLDFFFIGASATKRLARSRIFRYGCLMIIWSNRQKERV